MAGMQTQLRGDFNWFYGEVNGKGPKATKVKAHPPRPRESYRAARRNVRREQTRWYLAREERKLLGLSRSEHDRRRRRIMDPFELIRDLENQARELGATPTIVPTTQAA